MVASMTTTADIMALANDYANADNVIDSAQKQQALRLAVDRLVAERDALKALVASGKVGNAALDGLALALRGQP